MTNKEEINKFADSLEKIINDSWKHKVNLLINKINKSDNELYSKEIIVKLLKVLKED